MVEDEEINDTRVTEGAPDDHTNRKQVDINSEQIQVSTDPIEIFSIEAMYPNEHPDVLDPLLAYKAVADPDVMYLHQAMKEKDRDMFIDAMKKEVKDQSENDNFSVIKRELMPKNKSLLKAVW